MWLRILIQGFHSMGIEGLNMKKKIRLIIFMMITFFCLLFSFAHGQNEAGEAVSVESSNKHTGDISLDTYENKLKYWQSLSEEQRQAVRERAKKITPEQMQKLRERLGKFKNLSSAEAERIKANYKRFKQMPEDKRRQLKQRFERFQRLPEERKIELKRKLLQRIRLRDKEELFKDKVTQGSSGRKAEVLDLQKDKKQNRQAIIKKKLENRRRLINHRRTLRR